MTTCTRCGQPSPQGTATCPRCGAPLSPPTPGFAPPQGDGATPEWMRSLQAGTQYPGGAAGEGSGQGAFSVGSLLSEDALPEWLRTAGEPPAAGPSQGGWGSPARGAGYDAPWSPPAAPPANGLAQPAAGAFGQAWDAQPAATPPGPWAPAPAPVGSPYAAPGFGNMPGSVAGNGASSLFEEAALPDWLQAAAAGQPLPGPPPAPLPAAGPAPAYPQASYSATPAGGWTPGAFPGIERAGSPFQGASAAPYAAPSEGLAAHSLLDASALPAWLGGPATGHAPAVPAPALGGEGMAAGSLVDEHSLPAWLRQEPATPAAPQPAPGTISQWLAGPVTDEPLPSWLNQVYTAAEVPRLDVAAPPAAPWAQTPMAAAPARSAEAFGHLVDESALPEWLRAQAGPPAVAPASPGFAGLPPAPTPHGAFGGAVFGAGPGGVASWQALADTAGSSAAASWAGGAWGGVMETPSPGPAASAAEPVGAFSASDLIDPNALPPWARQGQEPAQPVFNSSTGWSNHQPAVAAPSGGAYNAAGNPWPPAPMANGGNAAGGMFPVGYGRDDRAQITGSWNPGGLNPAASLVDESNLPAWLLPADATPPLRAGSGQPSGWEPAANQPGSGTGASNWAGRSGQVPVIPEEELPPWLRDGSAGAVGSALGAQRGAPQGAPSFQSSAGSVGPGNWSPPPQGIGRPAAAEQDDGHYTDRFADERPGNSGVFSYAHDYANDPDFGDFDVPPPPAPPPAEPANKGRERQRRLGRK